MSSPALRTRARSPSSNPDSGGGTRSSDPRSTAFDPSPCGPAGRPAYASHPPALTTPSPSRAPPADAQRASWADPARAGWTSYVSCGATAPPTGQSAPAAWRADRTTPLPAPAQAPHRQARSAPHPPVVAPRTITTHPTQKVLQNASMQQHSQTTERLPKSTGLQEFPAISGEGGGFEPPKDRKALTGFRDRYGWGSDPLGLQGFFDSAGGCGEVGGEVGRAGSVAVSGRGAALSACAR